jgi:putative ATPase
MNSIPLAERMRPLTLDQYLGQQHIIGPESSLRKAIESGYLPSLILWGPPGVGKTTLANIIAHTLKRPFYALSAIHSGVKEVREVIEKVQTGGMFSKGAILFIDEIHRFSKSQQDSLLGAVEKGVVTLIGATTENPSFEVINALLSRCQVYVLKSLEQAELISLVDKALSEDIELKKKNLKMQSYKAILRLSGGDARKLLNVLELTAGSIAGDIISDDDVVAAVQQNISLYDKAGELHYDIISAFIKSMRGSDPHAAVYYLARMVEGGEDPKFIARRMLILAAEDIGLANPNALLMADATFRAVENIGWPESRIILSECAIYLATSPKSNSAYTAIDKAQSLVRNHGDLPVPLHLRNAPTKLMKELGYGDEYQYAHAYNNNFVVQQFLPDALKGKAIYSPGKNTKESQIASWLLERWNGYYQQEE